jgi:hypothetical protein
VAFDYPEEDHIVDYVEDLGSGESRRLLIRDGHWRTEIFPLGSATPKVRRFRSREAASYHIHQPTSHRNPDWHAVAASAKEKAKRAHEWSKPHAAKAWEATKVGARRVGAAAKRGSKRAAGSLATRLHGYSVANPDYGSATTDAEIRRHVASEASTASGHKALAIAHRQTAQKMTLRRWHGWADYHYRMADAHDAVGHSLSAVRKAARR